MRTLDMACSDSIRTLILRPDHAISRGRAGATRRVRSTVGQRPRKPMSKHYDTLETRSPAEREKALMQALPQQLAHAKANAPFFKEWLKDVDPASVTPSEA